jgi:hypothetical protein
LSSGILAAASKCLQSIDNQFTLKGKGKGKRSAKEEVMGLFNKKSKGGSNHYWKHRFVCLSSVQQERIPTTDQEKEILYRAGLGEKEIELNLSMNGIQFRDVLYDVFPLLQEGGGYQFLKCTPNSRTLELLSMSTLSSPEVLKSRIGAARTYIRPIQCDIDTTPVKEYSEANELKEVCRKCQRIFSYEQLLEHMDSCYEMNLTEEVGAVSRYNMHA